MKRKYAMRRRASHHTESESASSGSRAALREREAQEEGPENLQQATPETVLALQRRYGNQVVQRMIASGSLIQRRRPPTQEITFEEGETITSAVTNIGARATTTDEIDNQLNQLSNHMQNFWADYDGAINMFSEYMNNQHSTQACEPQYLDVALKTIAKFAFDQSISALSEVAKKAVPGLGLVVSGTVELGKAVWGEMERAQQAGDAVKIRDYITDLQGKVGTTRDQMMQKVTEARTPMLNEYDAMTNTEIAEGGTGGQASPQGVVVGTGASYLSSLRQGVSDFNSKKPSRGAFLQQIVEKFVTQGSIWTGNYGDFGNHLHMYVHVYRNGNNWSIQEKDSKWKLVTTMPNPAQAADALQKGLELQGKGVEGTKIPKMVHITVENEVDWALNEYFDGVMVFTEDPNSPENRAVDIHRDDRGWKDSDYLRYAWESAGVRDAVIAIKALKGSSD